MAKQYRVGRVFIAGDACHSHPPYGGFGLNSGLEDVANLGWKLAAVLQNWGGEPLLDSYDVERRPIFVETGEAMIAGSIERDRAFLERYSPRASRDEFERAWNELKYETLGRRQSYEPHYEGSPIVVGPEGGVCSIHGKASPEALAGHHLMPLTLADGRNVFEALGQWYTLVAVDADPLDVDVLEESARSILMPLTVVRTLPIEDYRARLILVRPDQYVAWSANGLRTDPARLLRSITGRSN